MSLKSKLFVISVTCLAISAIIFATRPRLKYYSQLQDLIDYDQELGI